MAHVLDTDKTTLLTDKSQIMERWVSHFRDLLNRVSSIDDEVLNNLPQLTVQECLVEEPSPAETSKAIRLMSSGKAPGSDTIPAEIYKAAGPEALKCLTELFKLMWRNEEIPQEFKDASIIHLFKRKGSRQLCDNHRGISLLVIAGKILARIILNRFIEHVCEDYLPDSQCGFRKGRSTTDMIFATRQLQEKCREQDMGLYLIFVDLTKAFDTVCRDGLWKLLSKIGCPQKFINMIKLFHTE